MARERMAMARAWATQVDSAYEVMFAEALDALLQVSLGDADRAETVAAEAVRGCEEKGFPQVAGWARAALGWAHEPFVVPDDVSVAGFDDVADGEFATPPLTTVSFDKTAFANAALDRLATRISDRTAFMLSGELITQRSTSSAASLSRSRCWREWYSLSGKTGAIRYLRLTISGSATLLRASSRK